MLWRYTKLRYSLPTTSVPASDSLILNLSSYNLSSHCGNNEVLRLQSHRQRLTKALFSDAIALRCHHALPIRSK